MKPKLIAAFLLTALICWAYPLQVSGQTAEKVTIHEPHEVQEIKPDEPAKQLLPENSVSGTDKQLARRDNTPRTNTNSSSEKYSGRNYTKEEVIQLIKDYSAQYGINPETPLCIAKLESGYNQFSKNRSSSASGVFQYLSGTWKATDEGKAGLSVFDADASVRVAIKYMAIHKNTRPWVVAPNCPSLSR